MSAAMDAARAEAILKPLFARAGFAHVEPPILQPAEVFLDLIGEEVRRRLYLTADPQGREFCLRPDFTIPVSLMHIAAGGDTAAYSYFGPAFRHRPDAGSGEFVQAGVESFGRSDAQAADADILALGLEVTRALGVPQAALRLGDPGLFGAFVAALDVPPLWAKRLARHFGRADSLKDDIRHLARLAPGPRNDYAGVLAALDGADRQAARALIGDLLSIAGIGEVGGRSAAEIADRFVEQAGYAATPDMPTDKVRLLARYFMIDGSPLDAIETLERLAREGGLALDGALQGLARRLDRFAADGVDLDAARFSTAFGRRLDYYTGFVFELHDPAAPDKGQLVGGGRYDRLLERLGAARPVPAVGCAVWVERFDGAAP